jgi:hypothetical protein
MQVPPRIAVRIFFTALPETAVLKLMKCFPADSSICAARKNSLENQTSRWDESIA